MFKKLSTGYKIASPGLIIALICFFLPWVLQSCGNQPMQEYSGLQLAAGNGGGENGYNGNPFVLLTLVAIFVLIFFAVRASRRASLGARDTYGVIGTSLLVLVFLFQQYLTPPGEGVNRQVLPGLWGYIAGWLLVLIGGVVNTVEKNKGRT
jgi:hypothetical protein